jgi:hypothetical protein
MAFSNTSLRLELIALGIAGVRQLEMPRYNTPNCDVFVQFFPTQRVSVQL